MIRILAVHKSLLSSSGESDAQATAPLPQRHLGLLLWEPVIVGGYTEAVQHQAEST
jgi:hypothetical protein